MNEIKVFNNAEFGEIRTIMIDNEPYFVGKDVAEVLGYSNSRDAIAKHVDDEDKANVAIHDGSQNRNVVAINESGLYSLILSSKLPTAKKFKRWVTSEILPAIRKTGSYTAKPAQTTEDKAKLLEIKMKNARVRTANMWLKIGNTATLSEEYRNICAVKAANELAGSEILALPKSEQKTYSAGDIGSMFGISAQKVGNLAKKYNLKTDEYGSWYRDKSPYSSKEVDTFRYNDKAVERFREILS